MIDKLVLVKSVNFGLTQCDIYKQNDEILFTREQIGRALEYLNHSDAIKDIHSRHKARLDKFSRVVQIALPLGGKQQVYLYTYKGLYEICRWSRQPKADVFIDWAWDVIEAIRKGELTIQICRGIRKDLMDVIQESGLNEQMHGWAFKTVTDFTYKLAFGKNAKQLREEMGLSIRENIRPVLPEEDRKAIAKLEDAVKTLLAIGYSYEEVKSTLIQKVIDIKKFIA
jgi:prophage antirepressor-like protein